ncbi:hypothetical protein Godav_024261 [Gossypium davidsonii]|uniref:RRM domain-containing protein n=2 Tax=Gossypium TaxID=3633 RepID=A0A7J8SUY3_GOSDV|nr:hypothetical protein [Gossypium davidsonii]MBA0665421.1 hypothetical protein [Gossypium klotzschianum]
MAVENGIVTTVFVYNIPSSMHWKGLWALFGYHGDVVDAFILSKRCRNGNRFGFVRFNNERNAQREILRLNGFFLVGKRIGVKIARYNGKRKIRRNDSDQKVQEQSAEIVQKVKSEERIDNNAGGVKKTEKRLIVQGHVEEELLRNLQKCLVCASNSSKERGLAEMKDDYFICKTRWKKNEEDSISETGSVARTRPEIPSEGRESVKPGELMDTNLDNGNNINECQQMLALAIEETESEYVPKEMKKGIPDEADKGLEKALKDVRDMGDALSFESTKYVVA